MAKKTKDKIINDTPAEKKPIVDTRTKEQRRKDRLALRDKAKAEAVEKGLAFDEETPAVKFEQDYDAAFMEAVNSPKAIPAATLLEAQEKLKSVQPKAIEASVQTKAKLDGEPVVQPAKEEPAKEEPAKEEPVVSPTEKTSAQLTVEAAKEALIPKTAASKADEAVARFEERNTTANEEPEAPTCTGVDVVATENPESETPTEEAPVQDTSGLIPAIDLDDPSTWPLETNGGLMRLPGESGKKYSSRKHKHKLWKREQAKLTETRNGDAPTEQTETKCYSTGDFGPDGYNSDEDGQSLPVPEKSAAESATVFEAAETETVKDEPATETPASEQGEEAPQEETPNTVADPVAPAEQPLEQTGTPNLEAPTTVEPSTATVEAKAGDEPQPTAVPEARPTLTLATSQTEDEALANRAQKFYGDTWTAERAEKLTKAFKFLEMAIRLQQKGESDSRVNMPMTSAIRLETEALGISVVVAKAA